jgi:putative restriction endonuclease
MDAAPSESSLIQGLKSFAQELDSVPTVRDMREDGPYSPYYYKDRFGSWHEALREADIQPTHGIDPDVDRAELISDLKQVDSSVERPPRRVDIDKYGEYDYNLYDEEFGSFVHALEEAGIEPDEKQYRFSSVETPQAKRGSENIEKLRNEGPTTATEMPRGISTKDRQHRVWKFSISSGSTKPPDPIYYIRGEHAPELVIRRFFRHNPHVLKYRDLHGIKIDIRNHQADWQEIGNEIIDELLEKGVVPEFEFENLVIVRVGADDVFKYCFDRSVDTLVDLDQISLDSDTYTDTRPIWGFKQDNKSIWTQLSEQDGVLFSTKPGVFTHYLPIAGTVEDKNVMSDLWVEYEEGVRSNGIEQPWPHLVIGKDVLEISIPEEHLADEIDDDLDEEPIQHLSNEELDPLLNKYGSFEAFRRNLNDQDVYRPDIDSTDSVEEIVQSLLQIPSDALPLEQSGLFEEVEQRKREDAFREGIYELYSECAICGTLFESPLGESNIEAAHIVPKSEEGPDILQNGLGLCSRHHWAFDQGWFKITPDYEIQVREFPELDGYDELKQHDGESLILPSQEDLQPSPYYLKRGNRHRE